MVAAAAVFAELRFFVTHGFIGGFPWGFGHGQASVIKRISKEHYVKNHNLAQVASKRVNGIK
jgi:hypothetical protein